jgi:hypothetical protein
VVFAVKASLPTAVLSEPVVTAFKAPEPTATRLLAFDVFLAAAYPIAVLKEAVV